MEFRTDATWSLVVATSMGIRLTPVNSAPVHASDTFTLQATSAESNVASVAALLGEPVKVLANFVEGDPISHQIRASLRARNIAVEGPDKPQDGPWGRRHQCNFADAGYGARAPRVWNDRAGEVGLDLDLADFDLEQLFVGDGVKVLHLSGLVAALSPDTGRFCLELARRARDEGSRVSFDLNHRASFWQGREEALREIFTQIAEVADILVGNEEDFQLALGIEGPQAGGDDLDAQVEAYTSMIGRVRERFGQVDLVATTLREVENANRHHWGAIVAEADQVHVAPTRPIEVLDRIGGGDGFVGGLLYGLLRGWDVESSMQFGWATGAMAAASTTDWANPADVAQVWDIWQGNARVQR